jgi:hypothetical protein
LPLTSPVPENPVCLWFPQQAQDSK